MGEGQLCNGMTERSIRHFRLQRHQVMVEFGGSHQNKLIVIERQNGVIWRTLGQYQSTWNLGTEIKLSITKCCISSFAVLIPGVI